MLALFRNNQFTTAILLALYVILTHLGALLQYVPLPEGINTNGGVLYQAWFAWATKEHQFLLAVGAAALVFIQALAVNILADEFRLLSERSWLPGMFYALTVVCLPSFLFVSPPLVAATFVPFVLRRIFKAYQQPKATALVFDAAFWTTVAALFYPPALFLLVAVYFGFSIMRSYSLREQVVSLTAVLTVIFLGWLWYFWTDRGMDFWHVQFGDLIGFFRFDDFKFDSQTTILWVLPVLFFLVGLLSYGTYMFRKLIQTQKSVSVLYWFWFVGGLAILFQDKPHPAHIVLSASAMGIFLAMSFSTFRRRLIAEFFHLAILGLVLFIQFFSLIQKNFINPL
ncbi:MAG: hypothetical protein OHK0019_19320 [Saprospiraceae bacterium]